MVPPPAAAPRGMAVPPRERLDADELDEALRLGEPEPDADATFADAAEASAADAFRPAPVALRRIDAAPPADGAMLLAMPDELLERRTDEAAPGESCVRDWGASLFR